MGVVFGEEEETGEESWFPNFKIKRKKQMVEIRKAILMTPLHLMTGLEQKKEMTETFFRSWLKKEKLFWTRLKIGEAPYVG